MTEQSRQPTNRLPKHRANSTTRRLLELLLDTRTTSDTDRRTERERETERDRQTYIVARDVLVGGGLNTVCEEAEDRSNPQQDRETAEQLFTELDPLRDGLGRS